MKPFIYKFGLQQQYDDLRVKDGQTMYIITDTHKIYIGDKLYAAGGTSSATDPSNIDLSDYATKNYVTTAISNIQIPNPDLSDYTTHEEMAQAIDAIQFPEPDLTICTSIEYANMTTVAGTLYLVIDGTSGNQTFTLKDSLGNIIPLYATTATSGEGLSNINTASNTVNGGGVISPTPLIGTVTNLETT